MNKNVTIIVCTAVIIVVVVCAFIHLDKKLDGVAHLAQHSPNVEPASTPSITAKEPVGFKPSYMKGTSGSENTAV